MNKNITIKHFKKVLIVFMFTFLLTSLFIFNTKAQTVSSDYASYTENEVLIDQILENDVTHKKVTATSTANRCSNPGTYGTVDSPQQVNILSVPSSIDTRVINYTYPGTNGWQRKTLSEFVKSFEENNPGWTVIAGVNGDFFDINANNKALPYQTTGTTLSDGDLLKAVERKSVGYTNNGTSNTFILSEKAAFSDSHKLEIFDENGNEIAKFDVEKFNELPEEGEIAVYYAYRVNIDENNDQVYERADLVNVTVPETNSYIIQRPVRCLPSSATELFAKGKISFTNQETMLQFGQFAIVTSNEEVQSQLENSASVRVQRDVEGDLAECDQIIGVGSTLMENGEISTNDSDGMRDERHPRTCIGVKEDGTLMFFVVDGRQQDKDMYGMTQDELGVMMKYYGCYEGVNIDGGGSSTFGVRNKDGEFEIMNDPSDNNKERNNSNALLIVAPTIKLSVSYLTDTGVSLSYELGKEMTISNLNITLNNQEIEMKNHEMRIDNLAPETNYVLSYSYDISYKGVTRSKIGVSQSFTTGKKPPIIENPVFDLNGEELQLEFRVIDEENLHTFLSIEYNRGTLFIDDISWTTQTLQLSKIQSFEIELVVDYNVSSVPNRNGQKVAQFNWYPNSIDLQNYYEAEQNQILSIIKQVNDNLLNKTKEEVINNINYAKTLISTIKTKKIIEQEKLVITKQNAINELNNYLNLNNYSEEAKTNINTYLINASNSINSEETDENIQAIIQETKTLLDSVLTIAEELTIYKEEQTEALEESVDLTLYSKNNREKVEEYLEDAKASINVASTKDEVDQAVNLAKTKIAEVYAEELTIYKEEQTKALEESVDLTLYSKKNCAKVEKYLEDAKSSINVASTKDEVDKAVNLATEKIAEVKTKNCKSNTIMISSLLTSCLTVIYVLIKKKH